MRRTVNEIINRVNPLKSILKPTTVPIAHQLLSGHAHQIMKARISVTAP